MPALCISLKEQDDIDIGSAGRAECLHILSNKSLWFPNLQPKVTGVVASTQLTTKLTFRLLTYADYSKGEGVGQYRGGHKIASTQMGVGWEEIFTKCLFLEVVLFLQSLDNNSLIAHSTERSAEHK